MKHKVIILIIIVVLAGGGFYLWKNYKGALPAITNPPSDITKQIPPSDSPNISEAINNTSFPLSLPKGFAISVFAKNISGARVLAMDEKGNLWVSQTKTGKISFIEVRDKAPQLPLEVFKNLKNPHGLAFDPENPSMLYIAEETKISRVNIGSSLPPSGTIEKLLDLPKGGRHFTRTLLFGSDKRLYVSIGSTCDVCNEADERYASIYSLNKDGSDFRQEAKGLRNSVFMALNPQSGKIWATEMGRDNLGDNLPPDEINIIDLGGPLGERGVPDFGWPVCFGQNIHDSKFDKNVYIQNPCNNKEASRIDLPAHSAPLGLAFAPSSWPAEYQNSLLVAFHGSWNRTQPTGYKIARLKLDEKGNFLGMEDFISGWLAKDGKTSLGRPVDILARPSGIMYISDDKAGVIYRVEYLNK